MAVNGPGRPVRGQRSCLCPRRDPSRSRVLISPTAAARSSPFYFHSTNFSSRTRRGYNKEEEQEEEDKGVSAARFGYWFRRILSSREQIFARSSLDIYVEKKGGEPTLSSDLSSINIPWTVFQKRHARGFPKYLRSLCANTPVYVRKRAERNEIVLASFPAFGEGMEMASLSGRTSLTKKQKLQKYTCTVTYANGTIETHG